MTADWGLLEPLWLLATPLPALLWLMGRAMKINWQRLSTSGMPDPLLVRHPRAHLLDKTTTPEHSEKRAFLAYSVAGVLMLIALAQPVKYGTRVITQPQPVDLTLIIDTSVSMFIKDYKIEGNAVDRMAMAKALLDRFVKHYQGRRLGLVIFGEQAYVVQKPSEDKNLIRHLIARLQTGMAGRQAALGDAISIASRESVKTFANTERVLVLISDAVQPIGSISPGKAAQQAASAGVVLHTIAIGAPSKEIQQDSFGKLLYEPTNIELLQNLANITGGEFIHAIDTRSMENALHRIESRHVKNTGVQAGPRVQQAMYIWPLSTALLILALINLAPYRRKAV